MKKIWIIDDDTSILEVIKNLLEDKGGFKVYVFDNPEKVLQKKPDGVGNLAFIDIHLKNHDGKEIVKHLKNNTKIPVIIMTADIRLEEHAKETGADGFIQKPFSIDQLMNIVEKYIS